MPNWKKVIVSGSDASLSNLLVDGAISASIFSGSAFTGSFKGDGANLTGIVVDDGLPDNSWDFNIPDETPINDFHTGSTVYLIDFNNQILVGTEAGKISWIGNSSGNSQLVPATNGVYIIAGDRTAGYVSADGYSGSIVGIGNVMNFSSSVDDRLNTQTSSFNTFTSSYIIVSSSIDTRLDVLETYNGSYSGSFSGSIDGRGTLDYVTFNTSSAPVTAPSYSMWANTTDKTVNLQMGNNATQQIGQELYNPLIVNKSGEDLLDGTVVMLHPTSPAQGNRIAVVKCISDGTYLADRIVGVLTENVANNQEGFATWFGYVRDVPKTQIQPAGETWVEGDLVYTHPTIPGALTHTLPTAPNLKVTIGLVSAINGNNVTIMVKPFLRSFLGKLHDVLDTSTTSSYGDLLMRSGSVWKNTKQLTGSYAITGSHIVTGSLVVTGSVAGNVVALSVTSGTASIDFNRGTFFTLTIPSSSITHITASNMQPGLTANIVLTQQATTGSVRWDSGFKFPSGSFNTGSASGSAVDIVSMMMVNNSTILSVGANRIQ